MCVEKVGHFFEEAKIHYPQQQQIKKNKQSTGIDDCGLRLSRSIIQPVPSQPRKEKKYIWKTWQWRWLLAIWLCYCIHLCRRMYKIIINWINENWAEKNNNFIHQSHFAFSRYLDMWKWIKIPFFPVFCRLRVLNFLCSLFNSLPIIIIWYFYVWRLTEYRPVSRWFCWCCCCFLLLFSVCCPYQ